MKNETKTIHVTKETHALVKEYCNEHSLKIFSWVDNILRKEVNKLNTK